MGYLNIENLYKNYKILLFSECYALEKVHGTSAHISFANDFIFYFSGGESLIKFKELFIEEQLLENFKTLKYNNITVYGEAYGGKCQKMSHTYGESLKFAVFDIKINDTWLSVPNAENVAKKLGLDFVPYRRIKTSVANMLEEIKKPSEIAIRNGIKDPKLMEGIVVRPLVIKKIEL